MEFLASRSDALFIQISRRRCSCANQHPVEGKQRRQEVGGLDVHSSHPGRSICPPPRTGCLCVSRPYLFSSDGLPNSSNKPKKCAEKNKYPGLLCWPSSLGRVPLLHSRWQPALIGATIFSSCMAPHTHTYTHTVVQLHKKGTSCVRVQPAGGLPGLPGRRRDFLQLSRVLPALLDHSADISSPRSDVPPSLSLSNTPPDFLRGTPRPPTAVHVRSGPEASYQHAAEVAEKGNSYDKRRCTVKRPRRLRGASHPECESTRETQNAFTLHL